MATKDVGPREEASPRTGAKQSEPRQGGPREAIRKSLQGAGGYEAQARRLSPRGGTRDTVAVAGAGVAGAGGPLPHLDRIQGSFGAHDVTGVQAHVGGAAAEASESLGAEAYATGTHVAFGAQPDLRTAAHEAAHVVQQRQGVSLKGGVGAAGDAYERHADAVADAVVAGRPAEGLLSRMPPGGGAAQTSRAVQGMAVQFIGKRLDQPLDAQDPQPAFGETPGQQRRYSPDQYVAMWEKEQNRKMTPEERETINRGCIGITATNLAGGGNPLDYAEGVYGTFELAHQKMIEKNRILDEMAKKPGANVGTARYVLFAKLFWSNQSDDWEERLKPDEKAFLPDPKTGEVDMTGYKYYPQSRYSTDPATGERRRSSYVNFDYGFWDEASQCFWHANHMEYKDPVKRAQDPMKVLQSTKEKFTRGYLDFDRIVFCIALANNYDPGRAALTHVGGGGGGGAG